MATSARRTAIIAIHGVADQVQDATAQQVADLFLRGKQAGGRCLEVREHRLRIPVQPLEVPGAAPPASANPAATRSNVVLPPPPSYGARSWASFDERAPEVRFEINRSKLTSAYTSGDTVPQGAQREVDADFGVDLMARQIQHYAPQPEDEIYSTICLELEVPTDDRASQDGEVSPGLGRASEEGTKDQSGILRVDVYEMYWADLSRLAPGLLNVASALYQILLRLSVLGLQCLEYAEKASGGLPAFKRAYNFQKYASRILSIGIPLLILHLCVALSLVVPLKLAASSSQDLPTANPSMSPATMTGQPGAATNSGERSNRVALAGALLAGLTLWIAASLWF